MVHSHKQSSNLDQVLTNLDNLMFVKLFKCFQLAISPNKMILAFFAIFLLATTGILMDLSTNTVSLYKAPSSLADNSPSAITGLDIYLLDDENLTDLITKQPSQTTQGVYLTFWDFGTAKFNDAAISLLSFDTKGVFNCFIDFLRAFGWACKFHPTYTIIYLTIACAILAFFGGAITRGAALEFGLGEKPGPAELMRYSKKHFKSFFVAPTTPFLLAIAFGCLISFLGFIANFPWAGELILGLLIIAAFIISLVITLILVGAFGGLSLMLPVISYEGTDGYDALGRSYCYTYSKPWKLIYYSVIAIFYGAVCYMFVRLIAFLLLKSTYLFLQLGIFVESARTEGVDKLAAIWPNPEFFNLLGSQSNINSYWTEQLSSLFVYLAVLLIVGVVAAFVMSYYFCASTLIYALMRKSVDRIETTLVYTQIQNLEKSWTEVAVELHETNNITATNICEQQLENENHCEDESQNIEDS